MSASAGPASCSGKQWQKGSSLAIPPFLHIFVPLIHPPSSWYLLFPSSHALTHLHRCPHVLQQQAALRVQPNRLGARQAEQAFIKTRGIRHPGSKSQGAGLQ